MGTCLPCMDGNHLNCGYGNLVNMWECRCDNRTPDCPGQILQSSGCTFDHAVAVERIKLARRALIEDGYFTADEVGDDVAPRISELSSHYRQRIEELEAQLPQSKTMRIRVLELPQRKVGEVIESPYTLIIDRCPREARADIAELMNRETVARQLGARGALVFIEEVELG